MKRTILVAAVILFAGLSAAEVGYDGPEDQPHIMASPDSGSASQSGASVSPNGTMDKWNADFDQLNATCVSGNQSEEVTDVSYSGEDAVNGTREVTWTGYVKTSNPCQEAGLTDVISKGDNFYRLNVTTESTGGACVSCVGIVKYEASFSTEGPFKIEILHDGEEAEMLTHSGYEEYISDDEEKTDPEPSSGPLKSLIQWLSNIF